MNDYTGTDLWGPGVPLSPGVDDAQLSQGRDWLKIGRDALGKTLRNMGTNVILGPAIGGAVNIHRDAVSGAAGSTLFARAGTAAAGLMLIFGGIVLARN